MTDNISNVSDKSPVLVICIGNPCREDDGIGIEFATALQRLNISDVEVQYDYQLNVEHALECIGRRLVIFVDASVADIDSVRWTPVTPVEVDDFTTHSMSPGGIATICESLYAAKPQMFLLEIKGYSFDFKEGLTEKARTNLNQALELVRKILDAESINSAIN